MTRVAFRKRGMPRRDQRRPAPKKLSGKALQMRLSEIRRWREVYHPAHLRRQAAMGVDYELGLPIVSSRGSSSA